ncbi:MAG: hypothetical protein HYY06_23450 [Deltaproteobacteria bacterium]|nr:hypothetical protein [Deltaproteobacteria bacterium]
MLTANRRRSRLPLLWAAALLLWSGPGWADDPLPDVAQMVRELRYEAALERTEELRQAPSTSPALRLRATELAALAHLGLGADGRAREAFMLLLTLDPGYALTDQRPSPRIVEVFQSVRQSLGSAEPRTGLVVAVAAPPLDGSPAAATARPEGEHAIVRVVFHAVVDGRPADVEAGREGPGWRAEIPVADRATALRLEVVARGFAPSGRLAAVSPVARVSARSDFGDEETDHAESGGSDGPITETPHGDDEGGVAGRWWFWTAVGAVVIGGAATAIVLTTGGTDPARSGDLGDVTLR